MSGHSKWATIKRKKGAADAKRGKIFSRFSKEITIAARLGGGDTGANPRLRQAVSAARAANMPMDNIDRAIKKGTGELPGTIIEEVQYEGYGPGGVALLIEVTTDNRNRSVSEIKAILNKRGGSMGESGCVNWMFEKKGLIAIPKEQIDEAELMELVLDAGAEDMTVQKDVYEVLTSLEDFEAVKHSVDAKNLQPSVCEMTMIPQSTVPLDEEKAASLLRLLDALEDNDDVSKVHANFDISDEVMEKLTQE